MKPAIVTFAATGAELAQQVAGITGGKVHHCGFNGEDAKILVPRLFAEGTPIIGICAAGILIRLLAPHLTDKKTEPPVIAISQAGDHIVPLLGGHHGANALARELAEALDGVAALTTASDALVSRGLDDPPEGWLLADAADAKPAMIAVLAGAKIALEGSAPWLAESGYTLSSMGAVKVLVTPQVLKAHRGLVYHPKVLVAGVGCERGVTTAEVIDLILLTLARENLSPLSLAALATIDIKADETALHEAAAHFGVPLRLFSAEELERERWRLVNPSKRVEAETGTPSVAEAAALKAGLMVVPKHKSKRATCAIGKATKPIDAATLGRSPGRLHLVGIGPGDASSRTAAAVAALDQSSDWVGYGLYLDLVADLGTGQAVHRFALGEEERRVRFALELAAEGKTVALVCSGDSQIYAMAALVFELLDASGDRALPAAARRVMVDVHPGISALQAASAAAGALIGHDFCTISLSDLLTPAETILNRLEAAATGDFVVALYNPRSQKRTDLIAAAKSLFLLNRPAQTPVIVASNLGRAEQRVEVTTLFDFDPAKVDMLTIVLIGASASRAFARGDGRMMAFTPRGYAGKGESDG